MRHQQSPVRRRWREQLGVLLVSACASFVCPRCEAQAQAWPTRLVKIIVPFPPGNASDLAARGISEALSTRIGQPVVVENRAGASGLIGTDMVAKAAGDGQTLLVTSSAFGITPWVMKNISYDVERDFTPVNLIAWTAMIIVANEQLGVHSVAELIAVLKANPGRYNYGHIGAGSLSNMVMELFKLGAGVDVVAVPYKGSGQAMADIIGGQLPLMFDGITSAYPHVRAGRLRGLAVSSREPSQFAPGIPPLAQSGVAGLRDYDVRAWIGMLVPSSTPVALVERINGVMNQVLQDADVRERLLKTNLDPYDSQTPQDAARALRVEYVKWSRVAREAHIEQQ